MPPVRTVRPLIGLAAVVGVGLIAWGARMGARHLPLLIALALSGCASTLTVAWGDGARAALAQPVCAPTTNSTPIANELGVRRTETTLREGKLGPDDVTTVTVTEPAAAQPAAESRGASISATGAGVLLTGAKWLLCGITLGSVCLP
jgi:hypothetical protein